jgi:hypothetical protein
MEDAGRIRILVADDQMPRHTPRAGRRRRGSPARPLGEHHDRAAGNFEKCGKQEGGLRSSIACGGSSTFRNANTECETPGGALHYHIAPADEAALLPAAGSA